MVDLIASTQRKFCADILCKLDIDDFLLYGNNELVIVIFDIPFSPTNWEISYQESQRYMRRLQKFFQNIKIVLDMVPTGKRVEIPSRVILGQELNPRFNITFCGCRAV